MWEFSGVETYHMVYDHFIGNTNCIHTIVFNVEDKPQVQLDQVRYWLHFLQSRIPPVEPLGKVKNSSVLHSFFTRAHSLKTISKSLIFTSE